MNRVSLPALALLAAASLGLAACSGTAAQPPGASASSAAKAPAGDESKTTTDPSMSAPKVQDKPSAPLKSLLLTGAQGSMNLTELPDAQTKQAGELVEQITSNIQIEPENCRIPTPKETSVSSSTGDFSVIVSVHDGPDYARLQLDHAKQCPTVSVSGQAKAQITKKAAPGPQLPGLVNSGTVEITTKLESAIGDRKLNSETTRIVIVGEIRGLSVSAIASSLADEAPNKAAAEELFKAQVEKIAAA